MSNDEQTIGLIGAMDQFASSAASAADVFGAYYRQLLANKIPPSMAKSLTFQFAEQYWRRAFFGENGGGCGCE